MSLGAVLKGCGTCRYADTVIVDDDRPEVICRRFPPSGDGGWPAMDIDDWCGEWTARPDMEET